MAGKPKGEANDKFMTLRLPKDLYDRLIAAAGGDRSLSQDIRKRLDASLIPTPQFASVLNAIVQAALAAAKTGPESYTLFEAAVPILLEVFRPDGERAPTRDDIVNGGMAVAAMSAAVADPTTELRQVFAIGRKLAGNEP